MGQAGRLPLPIGGEAAGDPRRSAQRASDGNTHMRCGRCGGPWPRPTHLSLCVVCSGMVGRVTHACVEYLVSTASIYKLSTGNLGWNDTSKAMPPVRHVPTRTGDAQARSQIDIIASSRERRRDACSTARALPLPRGGRAAGQRGPRAGRARSVHPPMLCKLRGTEFRVRAARNLQANTPPCIVSPRSRLLSERTSRSQSFKRAETPFLT